MKKSIVGFCWRQEKKSYEIFWPLVLSLESWHMRAFCRGVICSQLTSLNSLFKSQRTNISKKERQKERAKKKLDNHFVCRSRVVREINKPLLRKVFEYKSNYLRIIFSTIWPQNYYSDCFYEIHPITCLWHQKNETTNSPIHEFKVLQNVF